MYEKYVICALSGRAEFLSKLGFCPGAQVSVVFRTSKYRIITLDGTHFAIDAGLMSGILVKPD